MGIVRFLPFFLLMILMACQSKSKQNSQEVRLVQDSLIEMNKTRMRTEDQQIDNYVLRKNLVMKKTGTGLRYYITGIGAGNQPLKGQRVRVAYKISLLNGTLCYQSDPQDTYEFKVDEDNVESGLHEGIKLMKKGEHAQFILPSHLAHGLTGDQNKIPPASPLFYEIDLIDIKP